MSDLLYYLNDYSDEVMPCDGTLQGWADWLSKPDIEWRRDSPAADGATFKCSVMRMEADIVATRGGDGVWSFSREVNDAALLAVRYAEGAGWDADAICYGMDGVRDYLMDNDEATEVVEYVAVGIDEPAVMVTFHAAGPRLTVEPLQ